MSGWLTDPHDRPCRPLKVVHTHEQLAAVARGPVVVIASPSCLDHGSAKDLFLSWAHDWRNAVFFLGQQRPGTLAAQLQREARPGGLVEAEVDVTERVPLEGEELLAQQRAEQEQRQQDEGDGRGPGSNTMLHEASALKTGPSEAERERRRVALAAANQAGATAEEEEQQQEDKGRQAGDPEERGRDAGLAAPSGISKEPARSVATSFFTACPPSLLTSPACSATGAGWTGCLWTDSRRMGRLRVPCFPSMSRIPRSTTMARCAISALPRTCPGPRITLVRSSQVLRPADLQGYYRDESFDFEHVGYAGVGELPSTTAASEEDHKRDPLRQALQPSQPFRVTVDRRTLHCTLQASPPDVSFGPACLPLPAPLPLPLSLVQVLTFDLEGLAVERDIRNTLASVAPRRVIVARGGLDSMASLAALLQADPALGGQCKIATLPASGALDVSPGTSTFKLKLGECLLGVSAPWE